MSIQIVNPKKKKQETIGQVVFAFIKDTEDYKAAYVDYLHVTRRPAKEYGFTDFASFRGKGIGRLLLRLVLCLGLARSPGSEFDMYLKVPPGKEVMVSIDRLCILYTKLLGNLSRHFVTRRFG